MKEIPNHGCIIGIDPGLEKLGICIRDAQNSRATQLHATWPFIKFLAWLNLEIDKIKGVVIENPNLDSGVFQAYGLEEEFAATSSTDEIKSKLRKTLRIAQNVGMNKAIATIIIQVLDQCSVPFVEVAPSKRDRANQEMTKFECLNLKAPTKLKLKQYKWVNNAPIEGRPSEHSMDAGTLLIGRSLAWIEAQSKIRIESDKELKSRLPNLIKLINHGRH